MKSALLHVSLPFALCVALANTSLFDQVQVDLSYEHYAEPRVEHLPRFLAMPCNCLVNLAYICVGLSWLLWGGGDKETAQSRYMRQVFALMAVFYAPVQWTRLAVLRRAPAVLDQWFTLPIFAWVLAWIGLIERGPAKWRASQAAALELCSVLSYGLALAHRRGFEVALGCHVGLAVWKGVRMQLAHGDGRTRRYLLLAVLSCAGFVVLKLLDHWLARYRLFQRFTGHFWSKVCDVLQFHFSFWFLTTLTERADGKSAARQD
ncbi:transmembrane protein 187 [Trachinotus anak]|uniref:transmembrane protein 187 n=1 Tax=Trachinotus anak TaxID=443729 RepID=UPI0039F16C95